MIKYIPSNLENYNDITDYITHRKRGMKNEEEYSNSNEDTNNEKRGKKRGRKKKKPDYDNNLTESDDNTENEELDEEAIKNKKIVDGMKNHVENTKDLISERNQILDDLLLVEENCAEVIIFLKPLIDEMNKYKQMINENNKLKEELNKHINKN